MNVLHHRISQMYPTQIVYFSDRLSRMPCVQCGVATASSNPRAHASALVENMRAHVVEYQKYMNLGSFPEEEYDQ